MTQRAADSVLRFYDELAADYHLIYADWRNAVRRQGAVLDRLIQTYLGPPPLAVLDCSCGIGTQAIGLALRGYGVHGTDLSPASVDRAQREAKAFEVGATFAVADFRALEAEVDGTFDAVVSCDDSLAHLLSDEDLAAAARGLAAKTRDGGLVLASVRDYDEAVRTRPRTPEAPLVFDDPGGRRIVFQVWDWAADGRTYTVQQFIVRDGEGEWHTTSHSTRYRALRRRELAEALRSAGLSEVRWHTPEETGFHQPIVTARKR